MCLICVNGEVINALLAPNKQHVTVGTNNNLNFKAPSQNLSKYFAMLLLVYF